MLRLARLRGKDGEAGPGEIKLPEAPKILERLHRVFENERDIEPFCTIIAAEGGNQVFSAQGIALLFERAIATFRRAGFYRSNILGWRLYFYVPNCLLTLIENQQLCQEATKSYKTMHPDLYGEP